MSEVLDLFVSVAKNNGLSFLDWVKCILAFWGLTDLYMYWRWKRKGAGKIDQTASFGHWITVKWMFASQTRMMADKLPFLRQDLSEVVGLKDDDNKTT